MEWISINDRLPSNDVIVLVTREHISPKGVWDRYVETASCYNGEWFSDSDEYKLKGKDKVVAWAKLPKPYTGE